MAGSRKAERRRTHPVFSVSVAFKGFNHAVSLLFASVSRGCTSVAFKRFKGAKLWRESNWMGCEDFVAVGRTAWRVDMVRGALAFPAGPESTIPTGSESSIAKGTRGRRRNRANLTKLL